MSYVGSVRLPPKTLTHSEQEALLKVSGEHRDGFRDHMIFSVALGTALREHEIAALNVGDVLTDSGAGICRRFPLTVFKRSNKDPKAQEAILPDTLRHKLAKLLQWKAREGESLDRMAPLFASQRDGARLITRSFRKIFAKWQVLAGLERRMTFHSLRHTALSNLYRATRDIRLVQRVARHTSVLSTSIYTEASDEDVLRAVRILPC